MAAVAFACESQSTRSVGWSAAARHAARLTAVVVLPTPPFWLATAMMRAKVPPAGEKLAKDLDRCKMFHVERRERIWILFDRLKSQSIQRDWDVPRGTLLSGVNVLQIASGLSKGGCVGGDKSESAGLAVSPRACSTWNNCWFNSRW